MNMRVVTSALSSEYMRRTIDYLFVNMETHGRFEENRMDFWTRMKGNSRFKEYKRIFEQLKSGKDIRREMSRRSTAFAKHDELPKNGYNKKIKPRTRAIINPPGAVKIA